jgi:AcrR family transcriptional regulator
MAVSQFDLDHADAPMRADARRNRAQIIKAARVLFIQHGSTVAMGTIARAAGVGVGTLYRHFPNRETLLDSVTKDSFQRCLDEATAAIDREPDAWSALVRLLHAVVTSHLITLPLIAAAGSEYVSVSALETNGTWQCLTDTLKSMVHRAQAEGTLRTDVGEVDLTMLLSMLLHHVDAVPENLAEMTSVRFLTLILDGLRAQTDRPLPGKPPVSADLVTMYDPGIDHRST